MGAIMEVRCFPLDPAADWPICMTTVGVLTSSTIPGTDWLTTDVNPEGLSGDAPDDSYSSMDAQYMAVNHATKVSHL